MIDVQQWQKYQIRHEPTIFCSLLVNSELTWLGPEELQFKLKNKTKQNNFFCMNIDRTKWSMLMETCTFSTFSGKLASSLVFPLMLHHSQRTTGRPGPLSNLVPFNVILFPDSKWEAWASIHIQQKGGLDLDLCSQTAKGRPGPLFPDSKREAWVWASVPRQQKGGLGLGSQTAKGRPGPGPLFPDSKREAWAWVPRQQKGGLAL